MPIMVLVQAKVKKGAADDLEALWKQILPDTRSYDGCGGVTPYFDGPRETVVLVEHWISQSQHEKYLEWRKESGVLDEIVSHLDGAPSIQYLDKSSA